MVCGPSNVRICRALPAPDLAFKRTQIDMASPWPSGSLNLVRQLAPMHAEYIEPTAAARARILAFLVLGALVIAVGQFVLFPYVYSLPLCESVGWSKALLSGGIVLCAGVAVWLIWPAWKTFHFRQYPYPGADVFFRTRVIRGWRVAAYIVVRLTTFFLLSWLAINIVPLVVHAIRAASTRCAA